jgi:hypothetical protein
MEDNLINQYDEIDNIHRTLEKLILEITLPELELYKEKLQEIMFTAQDDLKSLDEEIYVEQDDDGDIFKLINEECYYDDKWLEEKESEGL